MPTRIREMNFKYTAGKVAKSTSKANKTKKASNKELLIPKGDFRISARQFGSERVLITPSKIRTIDTPRGTLTITQTNRGIEIEAPTETKPPIVKKPFLPPVVPLPPSPPSPPPVPVVERISKYAELEKSNILEVSKKLSPEFENKAKNFVADEPEILFVTEYFVEERFRGALLVWEKYQDATHYEIYKRNLFQSDSKFERIFFIGAADLEEERKNFFPYITDVLGFDNLDEDDIYVFLDHQVKEDRIYEYSVVAARSPRSVIEIDFDIILESKNLLNITTLSEKNNNLDIFKFSGQSLGSEDLAWIISLVNGKGFRFFGRQAAEKSLIELISQPNSDDGQDYVANVPKNIDNVVTLIEEVISIIGIKTTFSRIVDLMGGMPSEFKSIFLNSIDSRNVFSYDNFKKEIKEKIPVVELILDIAESSNENATKELSKLNIKLPATTGSQLLTEITGITKVFNFTNDIILSILYAQDAENFIKLKSIYDKIDQERVSQEEDTFDSAVSEIREEIANKAVEIPNKRAELYNILTGDISIEREFRGTVKDKTGFAKKGVFVK